LVVTYDLRDDKENKMYTISELEFWKGMVRPYLIIFSWTMISIMWLLQLDIPVLLQAVASGIVIEYFSERARKRFKEVNNGSQKKEST